jgi:23S rRNA (cytidine2498-2'-O)-methyltransferase
MGLIVTAAEESVGHAVAELRSAFGPAAPLRVREVGRGVLEVASGLDAVEAAERVRAARPVFVRHQIPIARTVALTETAEPRWVERLVDVAEALVAEQGDPEAPTGVQIRDVAGGAGVTPSDGRSRRAALWQALSGRLSSVVQLETRHPRRVLSVVLGAGEAWLGLAPVALQLSAWAGGERHFARRGDNASRAEFKLREALECFELQLPERGRAVDLGAAPGGWTQVLAEAGLATTAVDPGDLSPSVLALPAVRHVRGHAEDFIRQAASAGDRFEVLVNDMRMDAREAARLLGLARGILSPGAVVVTTLKLPREGLRGRLREALARLSENFRVVGVRQLFHNRAEVTAALRVELTGPDPRAAPTR